MNFCARIARGARLKFVATALACSTFFISTNAAATDPDRVEWSRDWPRVRIWEGINIAAMTAGSALIAGYWKPETDARWRGGILFDDGVRSLLRGTEAQFQSDFLDISDIIYKGAVLAPYIVDVYFVALGVHQNAEVALQMMLINLQSLGISGVAALSVERATARARPYHGHCTEDGRTVDPEGRPGSNYCGGEGDYQSFYSGHAAAVATMAGLTCVHHQHLPLYGGGFADLAPCLFMMSAAGLTGVSRIVGDRHWATDVIVGWGMGALSGYVLPSLLHYGFSGGNPLGELKVADTVRMVPVPQVYSGGGGLGVAGVF